MLVVRVGLITDFTAPLASPNQTSLKSTLRKQQPNMEPGVPGSTTFPGTAG